MDKLLRTLVFVGLIAFVAEHATAGLEVTIQEVESTTTGDKIIASLGPKSFRGFVLSQTSSSGPFAQLNLLACTHPRPCTIFFPSGQETEKVGFDTFKFSDACKNPSDCDFGVGRVEKWDDFGVGGIEIKGLRISALNKVQNRRLVVKIGTGFADFAPLTPGTHTGSVVMGGDFTDPGASATDALSKVCPDPATLTDGQLLEPCARLLLEVTKRENGVITKVQTNGEGDLRIATVSIACLNKVGVITNPCGNLGEYKKSGSFFTLDFPDITCLSANSCDVFYTGTYQANFDNVGQTLGFYNSGITAISKLRDEDFGREVLVSALAKELKPPFWISYIAANELYRATAEKPEVLPSTVRIAFGLQQGGYIPAKDGVMLTSIGTGDVKGDVKSGDNALPPSERTRNDRSYASYIPKPKQFRWMDIDTLKPSYDVIVGPAPSGDDRLGSLTFSDCASGSFYVRVNLSNEDGHDAGFLKINLGRPDQFTEGCREAQKELSGSNLMSNKERRVDPSGLLAKTPCCLTIGESQSKYGKLFVRSISVVVDRGSAKNAANYQVHLQQTVVNDVKATDHLTVVNPETFKKVTQLPLSGRSMIISKLNGSTLTPVLTIGDNDIKNSEGQFKAGVSTKVLAGPGIYSIDLCIFGGRCIPLQSSFTLP